MICEPRQDYSQRRHKRRLQSLCRKEIGDVLECARRVDVEINAVAGIGIADCLERLRLGKYLGTWGLEDIIAASPSK